jgi:hypothetical protein
MAGVAQAAPPGSKANNKTAKPQQVHPTGKEDARPTTADEAVLEKQLEQMTSRSSEGLTVVEHADGSASLDLQGRFMHLMRAVPDGKGGFRLVCSTHGKTDAPTAPVSKPVPTLEEK